jgi:adenylate cyclase
MSQFLRFVVEESLLGRGSRLNEYTVAVTTLRRNPDFDPNVDPVIRYEAAF